MQVTVVGKKQFEYTSKDTGERRNSKMVFVTHPELGVEGCTVDSVYLSSNFDMNTVKVGCSAVLDFDRRGKVVRFEVLK